MYPVYAGADAPLRSIYMEYKILDLLNDFLAEDDAQIAEEKRIADVATQTSARTDNFYTQLTAFQTKLNEKRARVESRVQEELSWNANYTGSRSAGVELAKDYEIATITMGGRGTRKWTKKERASILQSGKIVGFQGHHVCSVHTSPGLQGNPDNVVFVTSREHLEMHAGNFRNSTVGKTIDRDRMLRRTNLNRVLANEAKGFTLAVFSEAAFDGLMSVAADLIDGRKPKEAINHFSTTVFTTVVHDGLEYLFSRLLGNK